MAYTGKTNWQINDIVMPGDMNRIEQGVIDAHENLLTLKTDTNSHMDIRNKFNEFVKGVTGSNATLTITKGNGTTSVVTVNNVANASKATQDSTGQQINSTYIKDLSVSGKTITYTKGNNTTGTITTQDTTYNFGGTTFYSGNANIAEHDANNCVNNGHYYYNSNGPSTSIGASTNDGGLYTQLYSDDWGGQIAQDYRNGRLFVRGKTNGTWTNWLALLDSSNYNNYAPTKTGGGASGTWGINISGKANTAGTADTATKATQDSAGQQINTTYLKGLSISGQTITYTKGNGSTGTITVPTGAGAKSYITESVVNSDGSWYRKYSDGWVEQGGMLPVKEGFYFNITITLVKAMANSSYIVLLENGYPSKMNEMHAVWNKTTTSFQATNIRVSGNGQGNWYACGRG